MDIYKEGETFNAFMWCGEAVYKGPDIAGLPEEAGVLHYGSEELTTLSKPAPYDLCPKCSRAMAGHGYLKVNDGYELVCPRDFVIKCPDDSFITLDRATMVEEFETPSCEEVGEYFR